MRIVAGIEYYSPREIADRGLITNTRGNPDYWFVLRLIQKGRLEAAIANPYSKTPYYLVTRQSIEKYNNSFMNSYLEADKPGKS